MVLSTSMVKSSTAARKNTGKYEELDKLTSSFNILSSGTF